MAEEFVEKWTKEPAAFHSLVLVGGKTVLIEIYFDKFYLTLEKYKPVEDLDELCFIFDRDEPNCDFYLNTVFDVELGDQKLSFPVLTLHDGSVRIRVGAFLSYHVQERRIEFQGSRKVDHPDLIMKIQACFNDKSYFEQLAMDGESFMHGCGTRGIKVIEPEPMTTLIPTEIAALYSPYFYSLFYGPYKEKSEKFVEIEDMKTDVVMDILHDATMKNVIYNSLCEGIIVDNVYTAKVRTLEELVEIIHHCDQFMFDSNKLLEKTARLQVGQLKEFACDHALVQILIDISTKLRNKDLQVAFLDKFCLPESLIEWEQQNSKYLPPDFADLISEKKMQLQSIRGSRKILRFHFEQGSIACELLTDFHPLLLQDFIRCIQEDSDRVVFKNLPMTTEIILTRKLQRDEYPRSAVFETVHPTLIAAHRQLQQLQQQILAVERALWLRPPQAQQEELQAQLQELYAQLSHSRKWIDLINEQQMHPPVRFYLTYRDCYGRPEVVLGESPKGRAGSNNWLLGVVTDLLDLLTNGQRGALINIEFD